MHISEQGGRGRRGGWKLFISLKDSKGVSGGDQWGGQLLQGKDAAHAFNYLYIFLQNVIIITNCIRLKKNKTFKKDRTLNRK